MRACTRPGAPWALFLGGAYTFPRFMESKYAGMVIVAEIDPSVTQVARQKLGLDDSGRIDVHDEDARRLLRSMPADEKFDFVLRAHSTRSRRQSWTTSSGTGTASC